MRITLFTGLALAVALSAGLLWWHVYRSTPKSPKEAVNTVNTGPDTAALPALVPVNAPKIKTITNRPAGQSPVWSSSSAGWTAVHTLVSTNRSYEERLEAIHSLPGHLSDMDWEVLQPFLLKPDPADQKQLSQVLKNQLMDVLCAMNPPPSGLGDVLAGMFRDHNQNEVIRDYAVQHLAAHYEQLAAQVNSAVAQQQVQKVLWEAVNEPVGSIGGTALLALKRLSQEYTAGFDRAKIAAAALQMAGNPIAGELSHVTAYQICAQLGVTDALPVILKAAEDGKTMAVRMSAIAAMGGLGGPDQVSYLNNVLAGTEDRLKPAAQQALAKIATRQNQKANLK